MGPFFANGNRKMEVQLDELAENLEHDKTRFAVMTALLAPMNAQKDKDDAELVTTLVGQCE